MSEVTTVTINDDAKIVTSPLIAGDGIDLVIYPPNLRRRAKPRTMQLTPEEARELAVGIIRAVDWSEADARRRGGV